MSRSSNILWRKDDFDVSLYAELFAGRGYEINVNVNCFDTQNLYKYPHNVEYAYMNLRALDSKSSYLAEVLRDDGKLLFARGKYFEAMKRFNGCLKLAPNDSIELGLAYANRSSCFFHLNMLEECLIDIEFAQKSNYPTKLMYKLQDRIEKCMNLLVKEEPKPIKPKTRVPELSFRQHKDFDGVVDCLQIQENAQFGRYVATTRDLQVGDTILVEEAYSLIDRGAGSKGRDRCMHCFRESANFIPCPNCVNGLFCNAKCMEDSFHKFHCFLYVPEPEPVRFKLVMEMFFKINAAFPDFDLLIRTVEALNSGKDIFEHLNLTKEQKDMCTLFHLAHNHDKKTEEEIATMRLIAHNCYNSVIWSIPYFKGKFLELKHRRFLQHFMLHLCHISKHSYYVHELVFKNDETKLMECTFNGYASGIFLFAGFINHSCVPNVYWICDDNRLICKVIRPIKKGEQIFRCYSIFQPIMRNDPSPRAWVANKHHFRCHCVLCGDESQLISEDAVKVTQSPIWAQAMMPSALTVGEFRKLSASAIERSEKMTTEFLSSYDHLHPINATLALQRNLLIIWNLVTSRFELSTLSSPASTHESFASE